MYEDEQPPNRIINLLATLAIVVVGILAVYATAAFGEWDWNAGDWDPATRATVGITCLLWAAAVIGVNTDANG